LNVFFVGFLFFCLMGYNGSNFTFLHRAKIEFVEGQLLRNTIDPKAWPGITIISLSQS